MGLVPPPHGDRNAVASAEWFAARSVAALLAVLLVGVGFGVLATLVRVQWAPMRTLDQAVADRLNDLVAGREVLQNILIGVTDLGGTVMLLWLLTVGVVWLLVRRQSRVAVYVAVTALGAMILNAVVKELADRLRPVVEMPVYTVPGLSFPSGHAMSSLVSYGVLLLVFGPMLRRSTRRMFTVVIVVVVVAIGFTRMALGVHYLTDVVGGWLLGLLWLALTAVVFHRWRREAHRKPVGQLPGDMPRDDAAQVRPVPPEHEPALPHPWRGTAELAVAWVLVVGLLAGMGMLVSSQGAGSSPLSWDHSVAIWFAQHRNEALTDVLRFVGKLGGTPQIMVGYLVVAPLAVAFLRNWQPALFLTVALLGEVSLFLTVAAIVDRTRPEVPQLNPHLPPTASFPSGHVAAALVLSTAIAILVGHNTKRWWRWIFVALAILLPSAVAFQRLYAGVHYLSDVVGGVVLALSWTAIAWLVTKPQSDDGIAEKGGTAHRLPATAPSPTQLRESRTRPVGSNGEQEADKDRGRGAG